VATDPSRAGQLGEVLSRPEIAVVEGEDRCLITSTRPALSLTVRSPQRSCHPMPRLAEVCLSALRERAGAALRCAIAVMPKNRLNPAVEATSIGEGGLGGAVRDGPADHQRRAGRAGITDGWAIGLAAGEYARSDLHRSKRSPSSTEEGSSSPPAS
jgi:hypothetical protein